MISKISNWYFSKGALPYWCLLILDCLIILGSDILVYALNNGMLYTLQNIRPLITALSLYLLCYIALEYFIPIPVLSDIHRLSICNV